MPTRLGEVVTCGVDKQERDGGPANEVESSIEREAAEMLCGAGAGRFNGVGFGHGALRLKFLRYLNADHARRIEKRHRIGKVRLFSVDHARIGEVFSIERERQFGGAIDGF